MAPGAVAALQYLKLQIIGPVRKSNAQMRPFREFLSRVAAPHRLTEYAVRPYFVGGFGLMHLTTTTTFTVFDVSAVIPTVDAGVGAVAFLTNRAGIAGDVRRFQSVGNKTGNVGLSFGEEKLSFWRATVAVVIRY